MMGTRRKEAFEVRELVCQLARLKKLSPTKDPVRRILHSSHIHSSIQNIVLGPEEMRGMLL